MEENKVTLGKNQIHIVTGFFDVGRGDHSTQSRSNDKYVEYFRFWARMRNPMVIYTTSDMADKAMAVRREFGLEDMTRLVVENDIYSMAADYLERMRKVDNAGLFELWRNRQADISNNAEYNYIMLMKYWMMQDSVERGLIDNNSLVAWLDFGWNHGGKCYTVPEEYDYEWEYPFSMDRIHTFYRKNPIDDIGFLKLQFMNDSMMGAPIVCPAGLTKRLYELLLEALDILLVLDCHDDDQMLLCIAARKHPEEFELHESDWFLPLYHYGNPNLTYQSLTPPVEPDTRSAIRKILSKIKFYLTQTHIIVTQDKEYYELMKRYEKLFEVSRK